MSDPTSGTTNGAASSQRHRSVRFAEGTAQPPQTATPRSPQHADNDDDDNNNNDPVVFRHKKRPRVERPNADEMDDVDDWRPEDDDDEIADQNADGIVTSEHELLAAKRQRRLQREHHVDDDDDDDEVDTNHIDQQTSLATEGVAIEPFHMNNEANDGTGYFDGDTYVFRKRMDNEEPDAWLESLDDQQKQQSTENEEENGDRKPVAKQDDDNEEEEDQKNSMDNLTPEELYAAIIPLVSDTETIMQAIARYGNLLKQNRQRAKMMAAAQGNQQSQATISSSSSAAANMAQSSLDQLTEAASALLLQGHVDIYQKTRTDIIALLPSQSVNGQTTRSNEGDKKPIVKWEYQGSEDGKTHGPYTTQEMLGWIQAGYFRGPSAVKIRTVQEKPQSLQDDLLADLMEDDDENDDAPKPSGDAEMVYGEWMSSDEVDFSQYA